LWLSVILFARTHACGCAAREQMAIWRLRRGTAYLNNVAAASVRGGAAATPRSTARLRTCLWLVRLLAIALTRHFFISVLQSEMTTFRPNCSVRFLPAPSLHSGRNRGWLVISVTVVTFCGLFLLNWAWLTSAALHTGGYRETPP